MSNGTNPGNGIPRLPIESEHRAIRKMNTKITISLLAMAGALLLAAGCGKTEKAAPPASTNAPAPASDAAVEAKKAAEAARKAELEKAAETAKAAEAQLKAEAEKVALAAKAAEAQRMEEAEKAAAKLAESEKLAAKAVEDAKVAAQKLQAAEEQAAAKVAAATTASQTLTQKALSAIQQPGQIEALIASAKNLTGQNKYAEALNIVAELAKLKLTPEQQVMVDQVKQMAEQQMAKAMAAKATDAAVQGVRDLMGDKK